MTLVLSFVANAGINFILGLLVAYFLGPEEFGRYAIGAALMVLVNAACLDWLKLAAIRFYSERSRETEPEVRATLDVLAAGIAIALSGLVLAAAISGADLGLPVMLLAAAVTAGLCGGLFEYHGAIARARFLDRVYARQIMVKNLLALILMVGGAWITQDPAMVLFGSALSLAAALATVRHALADMPLRFGAANGALAAEFARYAMPLVMANVFYVSIPFMNRSLLAASHGFAEAGYFALASDMGIKLFGTVGAALELILLQRVVHLDRVEGREAAEKCLADNVVIVAMVLCPLALGLWLILPAFEALVVPFSYRGHFSAYFTALLPAVFAMGFFQAALNAAFMLAKKTLPATLAALCAVLLNLLVLWIADERHGTIAYAVAQSFGFVTALVASGIVAWRMVATRPSLRDMGVIMLGLAIMGAALYPMRGQFSPWLELPLLSGLGALVFAAVMLAGNVAGCLGQITAWRAARSQKGS